MCKNKNVLEEIPCYYEAVFLLLISCERNASTTLWDPNGEDQRGLKEFVTQNRKPRSTDLRTRDRLASRGGTWSYALLHYQTKN